MSESRRWPAPIVLAIALVSITTGVQASTTDLYVQLGDTFAGSIETAGVDTVAAHFNAAEGTLVRIGVTPLQGSSLRPTIVLKDESGAVLELRQPRRARLRTRLNGETRFVRIPESGSYTFEIGGNAGSGTFSARLEARLPDGVRDATLSGTVTNGLTQAAIPEVDVLVGPYFLLANASGYYSGILPAGEYSVTVEAAGFEPYSGTVELTANVPVTLDVGLVPVTPVVVDASVSGTAVPDGTVTATVDVEIHDGSTVLEILWTQEHGVEAGIDPGVPTDTATVTLGPKGDYKAHLIHMLEEPPIGPDQLPPNVPVPGEEFHGGLQDRLQVVGINPFALEEAALVVLGVEVTTTSGTYHGELEIHTTLPWKPNPGLLNVPIGSTVLLHGKDQLFGERGLPPYSWYLNTPDGSEATLLDATTQNPEFTPDVPGLYVIETGPGDTKVIPEVLEIYAGTWRGVVVGQDGEGRPISDGACATTCHSSDSFAPDKFTPWEDTGHAEIFTTQLNASTHYGTGCFTCHTVGFDTGVDNGGFDNAEDYEDFLGAGLINHPGDNWTTVVDEFPATAQLANIQCENCHGPQSAEPDSDNEAHGWNDPDGDPRISISSDVCAVCHGEPLRHARYQQWQLSAHANYELAIEEGESGNCSRCHTGNGFLMWLPILMDDDPETDPTDDIFDDDVAPAPWTPEQTHPQTCVTCHDPHDIGTTSGTGTNATVRISGDTPPLIAGFTATDVGRGAICMTCHNSRRGLRNDDTFFEYYLTSEAGRAPHGSAQTDVLMGQNAYLVEAGIRGSHSYVTDTCATCHMVSTPPPDALAYKQGGTNHTFYAGEEICSSCHGSGFDAGDVQQGIQGFMDDVRVLVEQGLYDLIDDLTNQGYTLDLDGIVEITDAGDVMGIEFGEHRGRQAITVTWWNGAVYGPFRVTDIDVLEDVPRADPPILYDLADPVLIKAGWNWNLFNNDGSTGIHNPWFAWRTLITTRDALMEGTSTTNRHGRRPMPSSAGDSPPWPQGTVDLMRSR